MKIHRKIKIGHTNRDVYADLSLAERRGSILSIPVEYNDGGQKAHRRVESAQLNLYPDELQYARVSAGCKYSRR